MPGSGTILAAGEDPFADIINRLARQLYDKKLEAGSIPMELYQSTAQTLMKGVFGGLGGKTFDYGDPNNNLAIYMRQNAYAFSAAKSLEQVKIYNELLIGADGKVKPFKQFRDDVAMAGGIFNKVHLETEYDHAVASAQMARKWDEFTDDDYLQISTVHDDKVRPEHAVLDGYTAKKTDAVWGRLWPPFGWNCRCTVVPGIARNVKQRQRGDVGMLIDQAKIKPYFEQNSGITRTVFDERGTYFVNNLQQQKDLTAERNYAMPSVKGLYATNDFLPAKVMATKEAANAWWKEQCGGNLRGSFDVEDVLGNTLRFNNDMRIHVMEDNTDSRYRMVTNLPDIVAQPDEVWSVRKNGKLTTIYIKYYEDYPYAVQVDGDRAFSAHIFEQNGRLNESSTIMSRRGILLYKRN
jgi:SPP1 gp7 family putative phage head morphogenesis protein